MAVQPLSTWVSNSVAQPRFRALLLARLALAGIGLGLIGAYWATQLLSTFLYGVTRRIRLCLESPWPALRKHAILVKCDAPWF